jgi:hypothetical protein
MLKRQEPIQLDERTFLEWENLNYFVPAHSGYKPIDRLQEKHDGIPQNFTMQSGVLERS